MRRAHQGASTQASIPTVALVGYTNAAGKTTLFNRLTRAGAHASGRVFVTPRPGCCVRVRLPDNRELLLSDTVGFIGSLSYALVAAFRATLEEVSEADSALHVIDASAADRERRMSAVHRDARRGRRCRCAARSTSTIRCDALSRTSVGGWPRPTPSVCISRVMVTVLTPSRAGDEARRTG